MIGEGAVSAVCGRVRDRVRDRNQARKMDKSHGKSRCFRLLVERRGAICGLGLEVKPEVQNAV